MAHHIIEDIEKLTSNKQKVQAWFDLGLSVKYGLSAELTQYLFKLYADASGDNSYAGRYNCFSCLDTIERKLKDFLNYGDNLGQPLINWTDVKEKKKKVENDSTDSTDSETNQA